MSRSLSTEMQAVATAKVVRPIYLVDLQFSSGSIYLWSGMGDLSYNSNTYLGVGDLLDIGAIKESTELVANGATVTLGGIKQSLLTLARDEPYQGRPLTIRLGAFDENTALISSPVILFAGFMDVMTIADAGETSVIKINAENKLITFQRKKVRRNTAEDQKIDHPNDKAFEFVSKIKEKEIFWGKSSK